METTFGQWLLVDAIFQKREFYQKKGLQRSTKNVQENSPRKRTSCGHFFQENSPKVPKRIHPFVSIKNVIADRLNHPISSDKIYHISKRCFLAISSFAIIEEFISRNSTIDTVESRFKKAWFKKESWFKKDCSYNRFFST